MTPRKPQNSKSPVKTKRRLGLRSINKMPTRIETGEVNLNGKTVEAEIVLRAKLVSGLTFHKREKIRKAANVGFITESDWSQIEVALDELVWESKISNEGVTYLEVERKIQECAQLAERLRSVLCDSEEGEIAAGRISWFLRLGVSGPDSAFEAISQINSAVQSAHKYIVSQKEQIREQPNPFVQFVERVAQVFDAHGVGVSAPKPTDYGAPQPSQFQSFIRALLIAVPIAAPSIDCSQNAIAALMSRISDARRELQKRAPSSRA